MAVQISAQPWRPERLRRQLQQCDRPTVRACSARQRSGSEVDARHCASDPPSLLGLVRKRACQMRAGESQWRAVENDVERERRQEAWLNDMLRIAGRGGHPVRVLFDELVVDINPDFGPLWLDRLLVNNSSGEDWARLSTALEALAECAGAAGPTAKCA